LRLIEKGEKMKNFRISAVLLALVLIAGSVCAQPPRPGSNNATLADIDVLRSDVRRVEDALSGRIRTLESRPAGGDTRALEARIRDLEAKIRTLESRINDLLNRVDRLEKGPVRR